MDILSIITDEIARLKMHILPPCNSQFSMASDKLVEIVESINQEFPICMNSINRAKILSKVSEFKYYQSIINESTENNVLFAFDLILNNNNIYVISMDVAKGYNE